MKVGETITLGGEIFTIRKEYRDFFLATDEFLMTYKRIAKLTVIK